MMKHLLSKRMGMALAAALMLLHVQAQQLCLVVAQTNGTTTAFALDDQPVVTFQEGQLLVTTGSRDFSVSLADVADYHFSEQETNSTAIDAATTDARMSMEAGQLTISGLRAGAAVSIYAAGGQLLQTAQADDTGRATIATGQLPKGAYIVSTEGYSVKIVNKQ